MNIKALVGAAVLFGGLAIGTRAYADGQEGAAYLGVKKCKMCHMKQHKAWEKMKHAQAFASLVGDEVKNAECVACHVTGFGKGGYEIGAANAAEFEGVQCEACHGPGGNHMKASKDQKKATITLKPDCVQCHNPHLNRGEMAKEKRGQ